MTTIRLLHISDLHLAKGTYRSPRGKRFLDEFLGGNRRGVFAAASYPLVVAVARTARRLGRTVDGILITGDLATCGLVEDLEVAHQFVDSAQERLWHNAAGFPTLRSAEKPIFLLPGNHDRYKDLFGRPGGDQFDRTFANYWSVGQGTAWFDVQGTDGGSLWIVACDLTLAANHPFLPNSLWEPGAFMGQGKAYRDRIERLLDVTDRLRSQDANKAVLWAVHFPPKFEDVHRNLDLIDGDALIDAAEKAEVSYILCGHTHISRYYPANPGSSVWVQCAGSASQICESPNTLHVLEIEAENGRVARFNHRRLTYSRDEDDFL